MQQGTVQRAMFGNASYKLNEFLISAKSLL